MHRGGIELVIAMVRDGVGVSVQAMNTVQVRHYNQIWVAYRCRVHDGVRLRGFAFQHSRYSQLALGVNV